MVPLNGFSIVFVFVSMAMVFLLPKRFATAPLLIGACYITLDQGIEAGPFHFPVIRLIILAGIARAILKGERPSNGFNKIDRIMLAWSAWLVFSSFFHNEPSATLVFNLGLIFNTCGIYFLIRSYCQSLDDVMNLCRIAALLLLPIAIEMLQEKITQHNQFFILGGLPDIPNIREGKLRAHGPFAHSILAGTVGATVLPLAIGIWNRYRTSSIIGIVSCLAIIVASASSGPVMSAIFALLAIMMWRYRDYMKTIRWLAVFMYAVLEVTMKVPAYYILARIDISGGSTGWHRARLIESSIEHLNEWWLIGTDYTRHWMPTGVSWSPNHADITNHYIQMGVIGGLPSTLLFMALLYMGFTFVGQMLRSQPVPKKEHMFFFWTMGASLFAHATTAISVSYFDQSFVFLYLTLAAISISYGGRELNGQAAPKEPEPSQLRRQIRYSRPKRSIPKNMSLS